MGIFIDCDACHDEIVKKIRPKFSFDANADIKAYRSELKKKFIEISGINKIEENICPVYSEVEIDEMRDGYRFIRFVFESEKKSFVPCYLLIPDAGKKKYPVAICLQGHSTGMRDSIGIADTEEEKEYVKNGAFALDAVKNGFAALCVEQRGMGERKSVEKERLWGGKCSFDALTALLIGRTILGERVWDVKRAIDVLQGFSDCDTDKIMIMGHSGGGTAAFYSAAYDERIKLCVPNCAFCTYGESILNVFHCVCNYMPHAYEYFDMPDLAALIVPRRLLVIAGKEDTIFTLDGVKNGMETAEKIYNTCKADGKVRLVVTPDGHAVCRDILWREISAETKEMGWLQK